MAFTFFFRDQQILDLIIRHVVPFVSGRSRVNVWDAGCAMGQEPYSLTIMFAESMGHFAFKNLQVYATDKEESDNFGEIVRSGTYPKEELDRIPKDILEKYFVPVDSTKRFQVTDMVRNRLIYQKHDLLTLKPVGQNFSLVMCKNVLLHFSYPERIEVIKMFHSALGPGGYFAMEQTQKMPVEIEHLFVKVANDGQIFKKADC
jgi:chemotaxis protein methyltransferase CheR